MAMAKSSSDRFLFIQQRNESRRIAIGFSQDMDLKDFLTILIKLIDDPFCYH